MPTIRRPVPSRPSARPPRASSPGPAARARWRADRCPSRRSGRPPGRAGRCGGDHAGPHVQGRDRRPPRRPAALADLHRGLVEGQAQHGGGRQLLVRGRPARRPTGPGATCSQMASSPASFSSGSSTQLGQAVDHGAPVVDRVVEDRAGQHQAVDQGDGHAHRHRGLAVPQAPAGRRPVHEQVVARPPVGGGDHHRPAVHHEPRWQTKPASRTA